MLQNMKKKIELLAPVGNFDCLKAAVQNGADAVYLGASNFNARAGATNFNYEQLCEAVKLCHYSSVKVYVTLNTLVFDKEISALKDSNFSVVIVRPPMVYGKGCKGNYVSLSKFAKKRYL